MKLNYVSAISVLSLMLVCTSSFALPKNECKNGFVWREAVSNDYVCVTPEARDTAKIQNRNAHANRNPKGGAFGNDKSIRLSYATSDAKLKDAAARIAQALSILN